MNRHARLFRLAAMLAFASMLTGCLVGPAYQRPETPVPENHRSLAGPAAEESLADLPWWEVLKDPALENLIREAISANLDLRVATARVVEARAQAGIAKSFLYPSIGASGGYSTQRVSRVTEPPLAQGADRTYDNADVGVSLSWEIDLFGRIRNSKKAAFSRYLATEEGRRGVLITLVGDVASTYFLLRQLDLQLEIAQRTLKLNDETVAFYETRLKGGVSNRLEVDQAVANRAVTAAAIPDIEQQIARTENFLCLLLGRPPGPIERGLALNDQYQPPTIPAGLPAALLERRPDVVQAEQLLMAANADVGAARALFFPTISLTGSVGAMSSDFSDILKSDASIWNLAAGIFQPIFQGGRIRRNLEASQARFDQAIAEYQKAALSGYREVADSLITLQKLKQVQAEQEKGVVALRDAAQLSRSRYDNGLSNYLEILIADQQLFQQELQLASSRGAELRAFAQLYRALGGGWQPEEANTEKQPSEPPQ